MNANKVCTALAATDVVHRGIEVLGGQGAIEDVSPLPRLYRDAIVFESWEGAHNVLCAQVRGDMQQRGILEGLMRRMRARLDELGSGAWQTEAGHLRVALDNLEPRLRRSLENDDFGAMHFRRQLDTLVRALQMVALLREAGSCAATEPAAAAAKTALAGLFFRRHLWASYDAEADTGHATRIRAVLGDDLA